MLIKQKQKKPDGIELKTIVKDIWPKYKQARTNVLDPYTIELFELMMMCREPNGLGYCKYHCPEHEDEICVRPNTCKCKICTICAKIQNDKWGEEMKKRFPVDRYAHITLTMPEEFREFFGPIEDKDWKRKNSLYELGWRVIDGFFKSQRGILTGGLMVLHTAGRALNLNPHLHIVMPAGGLQKRNGKYTWKQNEFISEAYLSMAWRTNLLEYIIINDSIFNGYKNKVLSLIKHVHYCENDKDKLKNLKKLCKLVRTVIPDDKKEQDKWIKVFTIHYYTDVSKKLGGSSAMCYVVRYTRRLPISKSKIIKWDKENKQVTWRYTPHGQESDVDTTMNVFDFIDKLRKHIAPKNFRTVRYYGIFSTRCHTFFHKILLKLCSFDEPEAIPTWRERQFMYTGIDPLICPCCNKEMVLTETAYRSKKGSLKVTKIKKDSKFYKGELYLKFRNIGIFDSFQGYFLCFRINS